MALSITHDMLDAAGIKRNLKDDDELTLEEFETLSQMFVDQKTCNERDRRLKERDEAIHSTLNDVRKALSGLNGLISSSNKKMDDIALAHGTLNSRVESIENERKTEKEGRKSRWIFIGLIFAVLGNITKIVEVIRDWVT